MAHDERNQGPVEPAAGEVEGVDEVEVLSALARLDLEMAWAYDASAEAVEHGGELRSRLLQFRDEHLWHVEELNQLILARGGTLLQARGGPDGHLLGPLTWLVRPFGLVAQLLSLLLNEQMSNWNHDLALELDWADGDVVEVLERHRAEEQHHMAWLSEQEEALTASEPPALA
ncbi:hypothetical protein [Archangium violaceum]|uniref:hypothetical protein n=1 Tax=Archangium violaceum TaxID=83451 RepID=UPI0036DA8548